MISEFIQYYSQHVYAWLQIKAILPCILELSDKVEDYSITFFLKLLLCFQLTVIAWQNAIRIIRNRSNVN